MIKFICVDVDGTLVPDGSPALNPEYYDEIKRLTGMGITFAVVSGRPYSSVRKLFAPVLDDIVVICENGACTAVKDEVQGIVDIPRETADEIIRDMLAIPACTVFVSGHRYGYVMNDEPELYEWLNEGYRVDLKSLEHMPDEIPAEEHILGVEMYHPTACEEQAHSYGLYDKWHGNTDLQMVCSGKQWFNFTSGKSNKGAAVAAYQQAHNILPSETMAFGDNSNDIGMLRQAEESYAVENAREEVKAICRHICGSHREDGVLNVLKSIGF